MSKMLYKSYAPDIVAVFNDDFKVYPKQETDKILNSIKQDVAVSNRLPVCKNPEQLW